MINLNTKISELREFLTEGYVSQYWDAGVVLSQPGYIYGNKCAELEALFRPFHLVSLSENLEAEFLNDYFSFLNHSLKRLLCPQSKGYVGDITDYDPKLNEAANLAFHFWVSEPAWEKIALENQALFLTWIEGCEYKKVKENNWILFRGLLISFYSEKTAKPLPQHELNDFFKAVDWIQEDGWITDGQNGQIDYYTGFVFYPFLILAITKDLLNTDASEKIKSGLSSWGLQIQHLVDDNGRIPFFGRSLIYRFAFISPFMLAEQLLNTCFLPHSVIEKLLTSFQLDAITDKGLLTLGLRNSKETIREHYSIRASTYWLARGLINPKASSPPKSWHSDSFRTPPVAVNARQTLRGSSRTYLVNANKNHENSIYFQHIIDSENGWIKLSSFGTIQKLCLKKFKPSWQTVTINTSNNPSLEYNKSSTFTIKHRGIYRFGWDKKTRVIGGVILSSNVRSTDYHLSHPEFHFKEIIFYVPSRAEVSCEL